MDKDDKTFNILSIVRHRIKVDGKGITTLVGLAGCPLNCRYCLNKSILYQKKPTLMSPESLLKEVLQDYCYFIATNGGITFGGGEPLLHYKQLEHFKKLLPNGVKLNLETSLNIRTQYIKNLIHLVDEFIIDIKDLNPETYTNYTGASIDNLITNLLYIEEQNLQSKCLIRVPLIPNYNTLQDKETSINWLQSHGYTNIDSFEYEIRQS